MINRRAHPGVPIIDRIARMAPGVAMLAHYRKEDLPHDLVAGVSVAAVALPVGVAYADLAGFNPVIGLYSSMLPLFAYALFGSSRQLIVGPDAATCALVAAAVAPLAAGDPEQYLALSMTLTLLAGLLCIGGSFLKLGVLADFLSRPILTGFMNGIALSIALGQIGKIFGFAIEARGIVPHLLELGKIMHQTHLPTLTVGIGSFAVLLVLPKLMPRLPAALVVMVIAGVAVGYFGLEAYGVKVVGEVPAGLPALALPGIPRHDLKTLIGDAASIALIVFTSGVLTARSFAAKNGYDLDADREMAAFGAANVAAALSQGFAVTGADSRTATNDAAGGRTQVAGLVAAGTIALVLVFLTGLLQYVPIAALGAVLVITAWSLVSTTTMRMLWREDKNEFGISIIATLGVVWVGSIDAILFAVVLALLRFVQTVSRPPCEVLGIVAGLPGFHSVERYASATTVPGLCLFRFNSPAVFFNSPYLKRAALRAAAAAGPALRWFVFDAVPITSTDVTGRHVLRELERELAKGGVRVAIAGRQQEISEWRRKKRVDKLHPTSVRWFPTLGRAVSVLQEEMRSDDQRTAR